MKPGPNARRARSRNGKRFQPNRNQTFESNGPEVKIRGTAQQVLEKYLSLAQDANSMGDRVAAEGYLQHAEHYFRLVNIDGEGNGVNGRHGPQDRFARTPESVGGQSPEDGATDSGDATSEDGGTGDEADDAQDGESAEDSAAADDDPASGRTGD